MRIAKTISVTLPPELLAEAQKIASREHRTMSELVREALRRYAAQEQSRKMRSLDELFEFGHAHGEAMGINSEEDVDRILGEFRTPGLG